VKPWIVAAFAMLGLVAFVANRRAALGIDAPFGDGSVALPDDASGIGAEQGQGDGLVGQALAVLDVSNYLPTMNDEDTVDANRNAMLLTIRKAEGTAGQDGYRMLFGGRLFDSFADHPRQPAQFTDRAGRRLWTSAAGAYQFMAVSPIPGGGSTRVDTWDRMQRKLGLPDFSPGSQDLAALQLIEDQGALGDVDAGRFDDAIGKIRSVWASLPGAGYSQPERTLDYLRAAYLAAGGTLA